MVKSINTPHCVRVLVLNRKADGVLGLKGLRFEFQSGLSKGLISSVVQGYGLEWAGASGTIVRVGRFVGTTATDDTMFGCCHAGAGSERE